MLPSGETSSGQAPISISTFSVRFHFIFLCKKSQAFCLQEESERPAHQRGWKNRPPSSPRPLERPGLPQPHVGAKHGAAVFCCFLKVKEFFSGDWTHEASRKCASLLLCSASAGGAGEKGFCHHYVSFISLPGPRRRQPMGRVMAAGSLVF